MTLHRHLDTMNMSANSSFLDVNILTFHLNIVFQGNVEKIVPIGHLESVLITFFVDKCDMQSDMFSLVRRVPGA